MSSAHAEGYARIGTVGAAFVGDDRLKDRLLDEMDRNPPEGYHRAMRQDVIACDVGSAIAAMRAVDRPLREALALAMAAMATTFDGTPEEWEATPLVHRIRELAKP